MWGAGVALPEFGDVVSSTENTATIHVPRAQAGDRTARLVRELGDQLADISVEDPPIEEVIDKVFTSERPLAEATAWSGSIGSSSWRRTRRPRSTASRRCSGCCSRSSAR